MAARGAQPICLVLEASHYKHLKAPEQTKFPENWLKESSFPQPMALHGAGAPSECSTPSLYTFRPKTATTQVSPRCDGRYVQGNASQAAFSKDKAEIGADTPSVHTFIGCKLMEGAQAKDGQNTPFVHTLVSKSYAVGRKRFREATEPVNLVTAPDAVKPPKKP